MSKKKDSAISLHVKGGGALDEASIRPLLFPGELATLRRGVIVEVTNAVEAKLAEDSGASCVLLSDPIHKGTNRMPDPLIFTEMRKLISIPIIVKVRLGHFVEAQILGSVGVKLINESDDLSPADQEKFIKKHNYPKSKFVCGGRTLGEALRRVNEGAVVVNTQGEKTSSSDNIKNTLCNLRSLKADLKSLYNMNDVEAFTFSRKILVPYDLVRATKHIRRLPAIHYAGGGIATPADAALIMQLGCDGVILGSEIFQYSDPPDRLRRLILAAKNYDDPEVLARVSSGFPPQ